MISFPERLRWLAAGTWLCLLLFTLSPTAAQNSTLVVPAPPSVAEAWLLTYGPGDRYWEAFGHNAIWIRDPARGLDHAFNFGFFDFGQENFFGRFLMGRMLYFSAARPVRQEFADYVAADRSIRAQKLDLDQASVLGLARFLVNEVQPENRDYLYDYYLDNCSTRVRDAIDRAFGGRLRTVTESRFSGYSWRDHTRRLTQDNFWVYLGLETVLGAPVDEPISQWEEMFIPEILARSVEYHGLATSNSWLYQSARKPTAPEPEGVWGRYLTASLAVLAVLALACRISRRRLAQWLARGWLMIAGLMGVAMLFFWFGTDHDVAQRNLNLLVFSPLWIIAAAWRPSWPPGVRPVSLLAAGLTLLALPMALLPPGQYTLDVLAAFVPFNLAAALVLWRQAGHTD
jgi:hypothetical protein